MKVRIHKKFLTELAKLPEKERKKVEKLLFDKIMDCQNPFMIPGLEKLKGHRNYYKIRFGNYRIGIRLEKNVLYFERILHRKDIYKYYP